MTACRFQLDQFKNLIGGEVLSEVASEFSAVGTDSREDLSGQLFFALKGDQYDAHRFVEKAVKSGAAGVVVHDTSDIDEGIKARTTVIKVSDTLLALQKMANWWRKKLNITVIAITGSNGKTTTKEFTQAILSTQLNSRCSPGSFNNHWGVPLSILELDSSDDVAVLEMGMNHSGELTRLVEIAEPNICIVTNVGRAHVGELGSIEKVAAAKEEIYLGSPEAVQVFNIDNEFTIEMHQRALKRGLAADKILTFSSFRQADITMRISHMDLHEITVTGAIKGVEGEATVGVFGRHNVSNLMAAASLATVAGLTPQQVWSAMSNCKNTWGRNQLVQLKGGARVLFDAYNANPESMAALVKNILEIDIKGKKVAVLGEMLELGERSQDHHRELGEMVGNADFDIVWFYGDDKASFEAGLEAAGFGKTYYISDGYEEVLANKLASVLKEQDIVVVKGSRGMKMERVVQAWDPIDFQSK